VAKKIVGTLTSNISKTLHISIYFVFLYKFYLIAIAEHFKLLLLKYFINVVGLGFNSRIIFFNSNTKFSYYSFTTKILLLLVLIKWFFLGFETSLFMPELIISLMAAMACKFIHDRHTDWYLGLCSCQLWLVRNIRQYLRHNFSLKP
jgi:hypothetical protein